MTDFTPLASLAGGILIGCAAVLLMGANGRIAGISGIVSSLLPPARGGDYLPKLAFVAGLIAAPLVYQLATGEAVKQTVSSDLMLMGAAGLLVGFGTVTGSGCTSGHGVCGLARLSPRSLAATVCFMSVAIVTVFVARHVIGG
ncbi:MAG: YeeE/YedE family protein [Hyphomicrobiales bacterium]